MADAKEESKASENVKPNGTTNSEKVHDNDSPSGSENGEKPVREKLKKTDLEEDTEEVAQSKTFPNGTTIEGTVGNLKKKRSYKDLAHEDGVEPLTPSEGAHARKKTREGGTPLMKGTGSSLRDAEALSEDGAEAKHSDAESDKVVATPPSSGDEAMAGIGETGKIRKKRSSEEMLGSQDEILKSPKVAATDAERGRRSLSASLSDSESKEEKSSDKIASHVDAPRSVPQTESTTKESTATKIPANSGFANTSAISPFASIASDKSTTSSTTQLPQTSTSAFAGSGFAAMASSASPFGALAKSGPPPAEEKPQTSSSAFAASGFANAAANASPFGATAVNSKPLSSFGTSSFASSTPQSGFSGGVKAFGSGFGSTFGGPARLSSFAAPVGDAKLGSSSTAKPFGAPEASDDEDDENENSETEDNEEDAAASFAEPGTVASSSFKVRSDQTTGEEGEATSYLSPNAKLFQKIGPAWSERGVGPFKLNHRVLDDDGEIDAEASANVDLAGLQPGDLRIEARFIMRSAATHKVIVNARIFREMIVGDHRGGEPPKKNELLFSAAGEKGLEIYLLRMGKKDDSKELYDLVKMIQLLL